MSNDTKKTNAPRRTLPLLPLRNGVVFPGTAMPLGVGRERSSALVGALEGGDEIAVAVQRDADTENPTYADLYPVATLARVVSVQPVREGQYRVVIEGIRRVHVEALTGDEPFWVAEVREVGAPAETGDAPEARRLAEALLQTIAELGAAVSDDLRKMLDDPENRDRPGRVADLVAAALGLPTHKEVEVLLATDPVARLELVHRLVAEARAVAEVKARLDRDISEKVGKSQREAFLRMQLEAIKRELGEDDEEEGPLAALKERLAARELPEEAAAVVARELRRLEAMGPNQAERDVITRYLELIADLPWNDLVEPADDLAEVAARLDRDHHGLDEVKTRILEHLAVRKLTGGRGGAVLCLVGPPGVGKTSLGRSIAEATGRPFARAALGAVRDEAEIRGHRRTYVGALPGRIIQALRKAKARNPVLLLDEVDKLGHGYGGSPEAALLELLDPEQNAAFTDHYLEIPFDLSQVLFICTANTLDTISPPLRDRLEIIELQGYTPEEKIAIARGHLLPRALEESGLAPGTVVLDDEAILAIVRDYTREAGVRQLRREIARICRAITLRFARDGDPGEPVEVKANDLADYLGKPRFFSEVAARTALPGVATGLAWTAAGGDILFVETSRMPGKGRLEITGQLGDVMKESARAALTYVRSRADELGIDPAFLERYDLHVHVPAGAVPKDGPSAGVTIFTALTSLLSGRRVRPDTAMTGECTLRGRVLPVGGIKAKLLAAHRAGIRRVVIPAQNARDLDDLPEEVRDALEVVLADDMAQVLEAALEPAPAPERRRRRKATAPAAMA